MPASEARTRANRVNSAKSTGPRTVEGKERSRANALKHGLTGAGVVLPEADYIEVCRRAEAFALETDASGEIGLTLVRRAALHSLRMERAADQQLASMAEQVRQVEADFVAPEGVDAVDAARLKHEATRRAMFDSSREATLCRQYEAASERGFFRALKELRKMQEQAPAAVEEAGESVRRTLASFFEAEERFKGQDADLDAIFPEMPPMTPSRASNRPGSFDYPPGLGGVDVPFAIGKRG